MDTEKNPEVLAELEGYCCDCEWLDDEDRPESCSICGRLPETIKAEAPSKEELAAYDAVMIAMARKIHSNRMLTQVLRETKAGFREAIYEGVKPHLKFKPLSYLLVKP